MHDSRYFFVCGRVQGVSFRASARDMAKALGVQGWIRNREDGCVEGVASGHPAALSEFHDWLGHGPAAAKVDRLVFESTSLAAPGDDFTIR